MKRAQKASGFPSLRKQIFLSCSAIILICGIFMLYVIGFSEIQIKKVYFDKALDLLVKESEKLGEKMENLQSQITSLLSAYEFDEIIKQISRAQQTEQYDAAAVSYFSNSFESLINNNVYVKQAFAVTSTKMYFPLITEAVRQKEGFEENVDKLLSEIDADSLFDWGYSMENVFYRTAGRVIPLVVSYRSKSGGIWAQIIILLDEATIYSDLSTSGVMGVNIIVDSKGNPVTFVRETGIQRILEDPQTRKIITTNSRTPQSIKSGNERLYTICCNIVGSANWKLLGIATEEELLGSFHTTKATLMLMMLMMLLISLLCTLGISHAVTKPLYQLRDAMKQAAATHFNSYFSHKANDVIGNLSSSYNDMLDEIKRLISQLQEEREKARISQLLKRRAELRALQAQINPHFLYNTLDTINWMALDVGAEKISETAVNLAELFRSGLRRGNEISELHYEITHVCSYLAIQKLRYGDKFEYSVDCPSELAQRCYSIRLLLQPLVENAIYHGIKAAEGQCHIWIKIGIENHKLIMQVEDDGVGFPLGKMHEINQKLADHVVVDKDGYGIFNVNERIYLYFGEDYGLRYSMKAGHTVACITIPEITQMEAAQYDQYSNR